MIRIRKDLVKLKPLNQLQRMRTVAAGLKDNAHYPAPPVAVASLEARHTAIAAKMAEIVETEAALAIQRLDRDALLAASRGDYARNGSYVEATAGDDRPMTLTSGYEPASDASAAPPLARVTHLRLAPGANAGELRGRFSPVRGADGYELQCSADPITAESWENCPATGKAKFTLTEQPTLTKRWARARAFRSEEKGPWSDSAPALVP